MLRQSTKWWLLPVVAMIFASLPWLFGLIIQPSGREYLGAFVRAPGDTTVYYRYIDEGRRGGPFMSDGFTTEDEPAILWQPLWWAVGRAANVLQFSPPIAFAVTRILLSGLLALTIVWATRLIFPDRRTQTIAAWIGWFGAGAGGLVALLKIGFSASAYDLWVSEGYPWLSSLASPHFLLVTAGLIFTFVVVEYGWQIRWARWLAGPVWLLIISIHPFHAFTLAIAWLGLTMLEVFTKNAVWLKNFWRRLLVGAWALPALMYYWLISNQPFIIERAVQNINPTYWWQMLVGVLPLLALIMIGLIKRQKIPWPFVMWAGALAVAVWLPVVFQRRFFHPAGLILAFVAAPVIAEWLAWGGWVRRLMILILVAMFLSPVVVLGQSARFVWDNARHLPQNFSYLTPEFVAARKLLQTHPEWSPVLTGRLNGNILSATSPIRPYIAHAVETLHYHTKEATTEQFFGSMTPDQQRRFIRTNRICSILFTPYEQTYGRTTFDCPLSTCRTALDSNNLQLIVTGECD